MKKKSQTKKEKLCAPVWGLCFFNSSPLPFEKRARAANKSPAYFVRQFIFFVFLFLFHYYYFTDEFHVCIYVFDFVSQFKFVLRSYAEKYLPVKKTKEL